MKVIPIRHDVRVLRHSTRSLRRILITSAQLLEVECALNSQLPWLLHA